MDRAKRLTLVAAIMGSFVVGIDATVVNVALPAIEKDLGGGLAGQQWVVNAYLLMLGSLILIGGSLGDLYGEQRVFRIGVAGFGAVSALCAAAPTIEFLVVARALQGVFGALLTPAALAIIVATFPPSERGGAVGSWTAWSGIATVVGPLAGGQIVDTTSWRLIFAINVPFVLVTLAMSTAIPPAHPRRPGERVDVIGAVLAALGLAGPTFALIEQPRLGWSDPAVWVPLVLGVALFAAFIAWERRSTHPMLPLEIFRVRNFSVGNAETLVMYAGLSVVFFLLVIYLQQVAGYSALEAGLATTPTTIVMFLLSRRFGRLADRHGPRLFMGVGPLVAACGLLLFQRLDASVDFVGELLPALLVFSVGLSMTVAPLTATVLAAADETNAGIASAVNNAIARVAGLLATAAVGAVVAAQFGAALDDHLAGHRLSPAARQSVQAAKERTLGIASAPGAPPRQQALLTEASREASTEAFHVAMGMAAALVALGGVLGLAGIQDPR
ncbi:MAG TPA: DHA2 family efflux MFS transporter permease subunit, partial [Solirubrobacteraceae bacterium]